MDIKTDGKVVVIDSPTRADRIRYVPPLITDEENQKAANICAAAMTETRPDGEWVQVDVELEQCPVCGGSVEGKETKTICDVCEGDGDIESSITHEYYSCPACNGSGKLITTVCLKDCVRCYHGWYAEGKRLEISGALFDAELLGIVSPCEVQVQKEHKRLVWRSTDDDGWGIVVGITLL